MSDRYLFRGKRADNGEWVTGSYIPKWYDLARISSVIIQNENSEENGLLDDPLVRYYIDPETIGQCTGLKDKSGTLIFEGDIVTSPLEYSDKHQEVVSFDSSTCSFWWGGFCISRAIDNGCEIIGNIHEEAAND